MATEYPASAPTGAEYDLASAGYTAMPDPDTEEKREVIGSDTASLREAAAERQDAHNDVVVRQYFGPDGKPAAANEAITVERAGRDYASATGAEKLVAENETSKGLAARVDAMRAEALAIDPDAAEFYGFELPEAKVSETASEKRQLKDRRTGPKTPAVIWPAWIRNLRRLCSIRRCAMPLNSRSTRPNRHGKITSMDWRLLRRSRRSVFSATFPNWQALHRSNCPARLSRCHDTIRQNWRVSRRWWRLPSDCLSDGGWKAAAKPS